MIARAGTVLVATCLLGACGSGSMRHPLTTQPMAANTGQGPHNEAFEARGDVDGVEAFVYGKRPVVAFAQRPIWVFVWNAEGEAVAFERIGVHVRLSVPTERFVVRWNFARTEFVPAQPNTRKPAGTAPGQHP